MAELSALMAELIREVPDFPEPGIQFKDLTPLLADGRGLSAVTSALAEVAAGADLVGTSSGVGIVTGQAVEKASY